MFLLYAALRITKENFTVVNLVVVIITMIALPLLIARIIHAHSERKKRAQKQDEKERMSAVHKQNVNLANARENPPPSPPMPKQTVIFKYEKNIKTCLYCKSKYKSDELKCPNCGAYND